jgi:DNA polymerase-4
MGPSTRAIIHLDMDAFYASVEQRDDPLLRGKPVVVGGHPTRGVVLAASYEVRPFGVRSAIPMRRALQLAPHAVVVPPRFAAYVEASEAVFSILETYTPLIEPLSLDEAFMDVSASVGLFGSPRSMATQMRERIARDVGLPASAGIAAVKFVAKMASDFGKPNGLHEVPADQTVAFLAPLPVNRLWGVGPKMEERLHALGLRTIGDVARAEPHALLAQLGDGGAHLQALAQGRDDREVVPDRGQKTLGAEDTFEEDLQGDEELLPHIHAQAERVARRLRGAGVATRVVQLKLKTSRFRIITRRTTLEHATQDGGALFAAARTLLRREQLQEAVRLTGVSAQELGPVGQLSLLDQPASVKTTRLNAARDAIAARFGKNAVTTADVAAVEVGVLRDSPSRALDEPVTPRKAPRR